MSITASEARQRLSPLIQQVNDDESWAGERKILQRVNRMIDEALRDPGLGIGRPERLWQDLSGLWSRRVGQEHRLVYGVIDGDLVVVQVRGYH